MADGRAATARTVLHRHAASAIELPTIPGLDDCYGISVHHCPYCDGWEERDKTIAVIGHGASGTCARAVAEDLERHGHCSARTAGRGCSAAQREQLAAHDIAVHEGRIAQRRTRRRPRATRLRSTSAIAVACDAIFFAHPPDAAVRPAEAARVRVEQAGHRQDRSPRPDARSRPLRRRRRLARRAVRRSSPPPKAPRPPWRSTRRCRRAPASPSHRTPRMTDTARAHRQSSGASRQRGDAGRRSPIAAASR